MMIKIWNKRNSKRKAAVRRITILVLTVLLSFTVMTGCESAEDKFKKEVDGVYSQVGVISFSDESVLTTDEKSRFIELKQLKDNAYENQDIPALQQIKSDWDEFRTPIQTRINEIEEEKRRIAEEEARKAEEEARRVEEAAQETIQDIVTEAKKAADVLTAFSFGTLKLDITSKGHAIVYSYQYTIDVGSPDSVKSGLEVSTGLLASTFSASVETLKEAGISSPTVIVEYKDKGGSVIYSREFK